MRPDINVIFIRDFANEKTRLERTRNILRTLAAITMKKAKAA